MLRVWVCAAHMGGFWVQNSLYNDPFFGRFSLNMGWFSRNWQNMSKMSSFLPQFIMKVGMTAIVRNKNRAANTRPSASHVPPPPPPPSQEFIYEIDLFIS